MYSLQLSEEEEEEERKAREKMETDGRYLLTALCLDFEQVDLEALLHLAGLLLGRCFFGTQTGDLRGTHTGQRAARLAPGSWASAPSDSRSSHGRAQAPLKRVAGGFHPPPPHGMPGSVLLHKDWQRAEKPVHTRIFMLSTSRPESDFPGLVTKTTA